MHLNFILLYKKILFMKKILKNLTLGLFSLLIIVSCSSNEKQINTEDTNTNTESAYISPESGSITFNYSSDIGRDNILNTIFTDYIGSGYLKYDLDTSYQAFGALVHDNKEERTVRIEFGVENLGGISDSELIYQMMMFSINYKDTGFMKKERLECYCDVETQDGSSITLDRLDGKISAAIYGKKVSDFATACLDGGGCLQICNAYFAITPNLESIDLPEFDLKVYQEEINVARIALFEKLELRISE